MMPRDHWRISSLKLSVETGLVQLDDALAARVAKQIMGERLQSELFFASLRRMLV